MAMRKVYMFIGSKVYSAYQCVFFLFCTECCCSIFCYCGIGLISLLQFCVRKTFLFVVPGEYERCVGVGGAGPGGAPLDGVDLLTVGLQVVNTRVLLHTPDLGTDEKQR